MHQTKGVLIELFPQALSSRDADSLVSVSMKGYDDEELQTYASGLLACSNTELLLKL
jgi:hypothetical protein